MADVSGITAALPQTTQQNPLQQYSTIQGIVNAQQYNKLMQQDLLNKQQELQNLQLTNDTGQTNLAWTKRLNSTKALLTLGAQKDDDMMKDAPDVLKGLQADHNLPDSVNTQIQSDIQNGDVKALRAHIQNGVLLFMNGPEALQAVQGTPRESTTASGQTQVVQPPGILAPPGTPTRNLGTPYGGGLSPEAGYQVSTIRLPNGQTVTGTMYQHIANGYFSTNGQPAPGVSMDVQPGSRPPLVAPQAAPVQPNAVVQPNTGATPGQGATPAPAQPQMKGIVMPTGTLQQQDVDQDLYRKQSQQYNNNDATLIANYKEAYQLGQNLATGSGTQLGADVAARLVSLGRAFNVTVGPLTDKVQARAELDKVLNQIITSQPSAGRSDAALGTTEAGQPHMGMDTAAMLNQLRILYGQTKQQHAAMLSMDPSQNGLGYQQTHRDMMSTTSREGFAADLMTKDEAQARIKLLGGKDTPAAKAFIRGMVRNNDVYHAPPGSSVINGQ